MRGHLQQRDGDAWRIKVYVGRSTDGRKRYIERTVRGTKQEADGEPARLLVEAVEDRHAAAAPMTFGELLDRWLAVKKLAVEPTTLNSYEWVARTCLRPALADRKLASLRPIELDGLYAEQSERGLSPRTVRICHTVIRQALEQARKWGLIAWFVDGQLNVARLAVAEILSDLHRTSELRPEIAVDDDEGTVRIKVDEDFETPVMFANPLEDAKGMCEVADYIQGQLDVMWPSCEVHNAGLHARVDADVAVWWCAIGRHVVSRIGQLGLVV